MTRHNTFGVVLFLSFIALFVLLAYAMKTATTAPDIYMSWTEQKCVRMIEYREDGRYEVECPAELPERYELIWIK